MSQHHIEEKRPEILTPSQPIDGSLPNQASKETGGPEPPKQSAWQRWKPRLRLSLALLLPVMLETLDYTSTSRSSRLSDLTFSQSSLPRNQISLRHLVDWISSRTLAHPMYSVLPSSYLSPRPLPMSLDAMEQCRLRSSYSSLDLH